MACSLVYGGLGDIAILKLIRCSAIVIEDLRLLSTQPRVNCYSTRLVPMISYPAVQHSSGIERTVGCIDPMEVRWKNAGLFSVCLLHRRSVIIIHPV